MRQISLSLLALVLAGCTATTPAVTPVSQAPRLHGLEAIMGKPAETALSLLGKPSLDRHEGEARQLQFAGACILDIFYLRNGTGPVQATHADARLPNGQEVAAGDCLQALLKARNLVRPAAHPTPAARQVRPDLRKSGQGQGDSPPAHG